MNAAIVRPVLIGLAVAAVARSAVAQQPRPAPQAGLVTRVFDVRDLTFVAPNYPLAGALVPPTHIPTAAAAAAAAASNGGGGSGGGNNLFLGGNNVPGVDAAKAATVSTAGVDGIRRLLVETVDPSSWKENGGDAGSITATDAGLLFVTQTPADLDRVAAQLDGLRAGRTGMVRVRADWVPVPPGGIDRLLKNGPSDPAALPEVDRRALDAVPHASASLACLSGQTVHLASGHARTLVTSATPVVAPGSVAFDVEQTLVQYGLALQVTPTVGGGTATLDLTSVASREPDGAAAAATTPSIATSATTRPVAADVPPVTVTAAGGIDRFSATVQGLQTTVQVPVNRPVLVGGMTLDAGPTGTGGVELYLVVEADTGR